MYGAEAGIDDLLPAGGASTTRVVVSGLENGSNVSFVKTKQQQEVVAATKAAADCIGTLNVLNFLINHSPFGVTGSSSSLS